MYNGKTYDIDSTQQVFDNEQDEKAFQLERMKQLYRRRVRDECRQLNKTPKDIQEELDDLEQQFDDGHLSREINSKVEILLGKRREVGEAAKREARIQEAKEREEERRRQQQQELVAAAAGNNNDRVGHVDHVIDSDSDLEDEHGFDMSALKESLDKDLN